MGVRSGGAWREEVSGLGREPEARGHLAVPQARGRHKRARVEEELAWILATGPGATAPAKPRVRTTSPGGGKTAQGPPVARVNVVLPKELPGQLGLKKRGALGPRIPSARVQRPTAQAPGCAAALPTTRAQAQWPGLLHTLSSLARGVC